MNFHFVKWCCCLFCFIIVVIDLHLFDEKKCRNEWRHFTKIKGKNNSTMIFFDVFIENQNIFKKINRWKIEMKKCVCFDRFFHINVCLFIFFTFRVHLWIKYASFFFESIHFFHHRLFLLLCVRISLFFFRWLLLSFFCVCYFRMIIVWLCWFKLFYFNFISFYFIFVWKVCQSCFFSIF